jgi:hypothetical protein
VEEIPATTNDKTKMPGFATPTNVIGVDANRRDSHTPGESPALQEVGEERFLTVPADLLQEQEAGKNRPAAFEMTGGGVAAFVSELKLRPPKAGGEEGWDIDSLTRTCGRHILSSSEIAKMSNSSQQEMTG